ncbi:MAG: hypothetical protein LQ346_002332 [Caloplaca aetnensis]|nr:MAG: hypothetical protein LQ346_002332 [Caloplaca aetnensis]
MVLPAVPSGPLPRLRRPEPNDDKYELPRSTGNHRDSSLDSSGKTMAEEMAALFNPSSIARGIDTVKSSVQKAQPRPKNIPRSCLSPKRRHERAEMDNPSIPSISEEDLAEVSALLTPRSKKRQAKEALGEPSTTMSMSSAVSSRSSKRLRTGSPPSPVTWSPSSINLEAMGPSRKKMEMLEYKRTLKRREQLKQATADGSTKSAWVIEWMDDIRVIRSRSWSPSPHQIHNIAIRVRTM